MIHDEEDIFVHCTTQFGNSLISLSMEKRDDNGFSFVWTKLIE